MTAHPKARAIAAVPLAKGGGSRVVAIDERDVFHLCTGDDRLVGQSVEKSSAADTARGIAWRMGDERVLTPSGTMRILAAAVLNQGVMR